jgi:hypothetical protein
MEEKRCHDCNREEGEIHSLGCDMESCPWCGGQLISCHCVYEKLNIDCSPGTWAYENGITKEQETVWEELLEKEGRIPYIRWPNLCAYCGELWPELFMVPDEEWEKYIEPGKRDRVVCRKCYEYIKSLIEGAKKNENRNNGI